MAISLDEVRRRILIALFSDDELMDSLVLKGGNALALIYKVGARASLDLDFSIESSFVDPQGAAERIYSTLSREFVSIGYVVFDKQFKLRPSRPSRDQPEWWGGYTVEFKLIEKKIYDELHGDAGALRRRAEELGPLQRRKYTIDISQHEFCEGKVQREVDDYVIYVYSLEMIVAEKLRAICQQMSEYAFGRAKKPRARDFYDIFQVVTSNNIDLTTPKNRSTVEAVFAAKQVPMRLLGEIQKYREFHAPDWPSVEASISGPRKAFGFYFNFVVGLGMALHSLWKE